VRASVQDDPDPKLIESFSIFDPWCHRERQCIKRITSWLTLQGLNKVFLKTSDQSPGLVQQLDVENIPAVERHLKPRGDLYVVADRVLLCSAKWS